MRKINGILVVAFSASVLAGCGEDASSDPPANDASTPDDAARDSGNDTRSDAGRDAASGALGAPSGVSAAAVPVVTTVTTLAGSGSLGFADGTGAAASFRFPEGVAVDTAGNVYVGDSENNRIRVITPTGAVTTLAGSGTGAGTGAGAFADGTGTAASFWRPNAVTVDLAGTVYVADSLNNRIRKVTKAGVVTTLAGSGTSAFADGTGTAASFRSPYGVALDATGNLLVADAFNNRIRSVTPAGVVTTLAGSGAAAFADGTRTVASFNAPYGIAVGGAGDLYVGDGENNRIRKVTSTGTVTTVAGSGTAAFADGTGAAASFHQPRGVGVDGAGNAYVADFWNNCIRKVTRAGVVTTVAGSGTGAFADGAGVAASFNRPGAVGVEASGNVYVADTFNNRIRKLTFTGGIGQLAVSWQVPSTAGSSSITGYTAVASAAGQTTHTCTTTGATSCTISGLTSGVVYSVVVTASNTADTSAPSTPVSSTPN